MQPHRLAYCSCERTGIIPSICQCGQQLVDGNPTIRIAIANSSSTQHMQQQHHQQSPSHMVPPPPLPVPVFPQQVDPRQSYNFYQAAQMYGNQVVHHQQRRGGGGTRRDRDRETDQSNSRVKCVTCPYMKRINRHPQCWRCHDAGVPLPNINEGAIDQAVSVPRSIPPSPVNNMGGNVIEAWEQQLRIAAENFDPRNRGTLLEQVRQGGSELPVPMDIETELPSDRQPSEPSNRQSRESRSMSRAETRRADSQRSNSQHSSHSRGHDSISPTRSMRQTPLTSPYPSSRTGTNPFDGEARVDVQDVFASRSPSPMPFQPPADNVKAGIFGIDAQQRENAQKLFDNAKQLWNPGFPSMQHGGFEYQKEKIYVPKQLTQKMREQSNWICDVVGLKFLDIAQVPPPIIDDITKLQTYMCGLGNSFSDLEMMAALATFVKSALGTHIKQVQNQLKQLAERQKQAQEAVHAASQPSAAQSQPGTPTQTIIDMLQRHSQLANPETRDICANVVKLLQDLKTQQLINSEIPPTQISMPTQQVPLGGSSPFMPMPSTPTMPVSFSPNMQAPVSPSMPVTVNSSINTPQGTTPPAREDTPQSVAKGTPNQNADRMLLEMQNAMAAQTEIHSDGSMLSPVREEGVLDTSGSSQEEVPCPYIEDMENVYQKVGSSNKNQDQLNAMNAWGSAGNAAEESQTPVLTEEQWKRMSEPIDEDKSKSPDSKRARKEKSLIKERAKQDRQNRKPAGCPSSVGAAVVKSKSSKQTSKRNVKS